MMLPTIHNLRIFVGIHIHSIFKTVISIFRIMSKMLKDKAICHLLVLALSIEEFTINYSLFTEDIHLTEEQ